MSKKCVNFALSEKGRCRGRTSAICPVIGRRVGEEKMKKSPLGLFLAPATGIEPITTP